MAVTYEALEATFKFIDEFQMELCVVGKICLVFVCGSGGHIELDETTKMDINTKERQTIDC